MKQTDRPSELTIEFREIVDEMGVKDFFLKKILFVQKQNDRRVLKPRVGDDRAEQGLTLVHPVLKRAKEHNQMRKPSVLQLVLRKHKFARMLNSVGRAAATAFHEFHAYHIEELVGFLS